MEDGTDVIERVRRSPASIVLAFHLCELSLYEARFEMLHSDPGAFDQNNELLFAEDGRSG